MRVHSLAPTQRESPGESTICGGRPPRVAILLSVFNGARYLDDLLLSLKLQRDVEPVLVVRDDGSTDSSLETLDGWKESMDIRWVPGSGTHIGLPNSFFELMRWVPSGIRFAAFCDQDDLWHPDKLATALQALSTDGPSLWCSNYELIGSHGEALAARSGIAVRYSQDVGVAELAARTLAPGCTMVVNRALLDTLLAFDPHQTVMHDALAGIVAASIGTIVVEPRPLLSYRLHSENAIGIPSMGSWRWLRGWIRSRRKWRTQARHVVDTLGPVLSNQDRCALIAEGSGGVLHLHARLIIFFRSRRQLSSLGIQGLARLLFG